MRYYLLSASLFLLCGLMLASSSQSSAEKVLSAYLTGDCNGVRLSSKSASDSRKLVTWQEEPGWDQLLLIFSYEIKPGSATADSATFNVTYTVLAKEDGEALQLFQAPTKETQVFVLVRVKGSWRISSPTIPPHVCKTALVMHIKGLLALENQDSPRKKSLLTELHDLEKMK